MNYIHKIGITGCFILILLGHGFAYGDDVKTQKILSETTIISMSPGKGPGQYYHIFSGGYSLSPSCFAIDPNDGSFYIPELDTRYKIRVHKFDKTGKFVDMFRVERKVRGLYEIAVDLNGDLYLCCGTSRNGNYLVKCDKGGKISNLFGPEGPITDEDIAKADKWSPETGSYRKKLFKGVFKSFSVIDGALEIVTQNEYDKRLFRRFNSRTRQKLKEEEKIPAHIKEKIKKRKEMLDILYKVHFEQKRKGGIGRSVIDIDGGFYYMCVSPDKLEIRKVSFSKQ